MSAVCSEFLSSQCAPQVLQTAEPGFIEAEEGEKTMRPDECSYSWKVA